MNLYMVAYHGRSYFLIGKLTDAQINQIDEFCKETYILNVYCPDELFTFLKENKFNVEVKAVDHIFRIKN